jgi:hypothetical protein
VQFFSGDLGHYVELAGQTITIIGGIWGVVKKGVSKVDRIVGERITANSNRNRDELTVILKAYIDEKFKEHETNAFARLDKIAERRGS